ncbi:RHS repeat-associated core domain-containing protein [Variovorax robiniae]|uniref:RHS repeat-associated core domain-containing protein n=1 Tax=Variovorax robiniae TaxID=1836199 RepID=A0ABU8XDZ5_9BURK
MHYNRYRYYDPGSGRFVSSDPIKLAGGLNLQQFAPNSTGWIDPLGLSRYVVIGEGQASVEGKIPVPRIQNNWKRLGGSSKGIRCLSFRARYKRMGAKGRWGECEMDSRPSSRRVWIYRHRPRWRQSESVLCGGKESSGSNRCKNL